MDDAELLEQALDEGSQAHRLLEERPDLLALFCELVAEERLLSHALADGDDGFQDRVMAAISAARRAPQRRAPGRRHPWRPWLLATAACLACAVLALLHFQPPPPALAWIDALEGTVSAAGEPVQVGEGLPAGRVLAVPEGGEATLRFPDGSLVAVGGGGNLAVTAQPDGVEVELAQGRITATVAPQGVGRHFSVRCPRARVRVVGTVFTLLTTADHAHLDVSEGTVQVERLSDGAQARVDRGRWLEVADGRPLVSQSGTGDRETTARITTFILCDAATGTALPGGDPLKDGSQINLGALPGRPVNIRAEGTAEVDEVLFTCDGPQAQAHAHAHAHAHYRHREEIAPYYLYGNRGEVIFPWTPAAGTYRLTAVPRDRHGHDGPPATVTFLIRR